MSTPSDKSIGGYFGLELPTQEDKFLHIDSILLNTARNCFEYILRASNITKVYMPAYTCAVMYEPLLKMGLAYETYNLTDSLEILDAPEIKNNEMLLYTNYFGLKDDYCDELSRQYGESLVLDCAQALFYSPKYPCHVFYSLRKFIGVADGACLYTSKILCDYESLPLDHSSERAKHLLIRLEDGAEMGYEEFVKNDSSLNNNQIMKLSLLTRRIIQSVDFDMVAKRRQNNFKHLRQHLSPLVECTRDSTVPMIFPFIAHNLDVRQRLIDKKIFLAKYWPDILHGDRMGSNETLLTERLIALPIDQRYNERDMQRIVEAVNESNY